MELLILSLIQIESRKDGLKICVNCLFKLEKKPLKKTYNKFEESLTPRSFLHLRKAPKKLRPYSCEARYKKKNLKGITASKFSLKNLTNCWTNFGAVSWTNLERF